MKRGATRKTRSHHDVQQFFLDQLHVHFLNRRKALQVVNKTLGTNLGPKDIEEWMEAEEFQEWYKDTYDAIKDLLQEQSLRIALGDKPKTRDATHLRWVMEKLDERYAQQTKHLVHHQHSGQVTHVAGHTQGQLDNEIGEILSLGAPDTVEPEFDVLGDVLGEPEAVGQGTTSRPAKGA